MNSENFNIGWNTKKAAGYRTLPLLFVHQYDSVTEARSCINAEFQYTVTSLVE